MKNCLSQRTADSHLGGIAETQHVIDYCTARNIKADIELTVQKRSTGRMSGS
jgi:hypothetical protein